MSEQEHQEVCSESVEQPGQRPLEDDKELHQGVSSDGDEFEDIGETAETEVDLVAEDFEGDFGGGLIESVPGFDPTEALMEGIESSQSLITEDLASLAPNCRMEFESPESVCGRDGRIQIRGTTSVPWRWICQLIITRRDGRQSRCTGWFIGPCTVMTAGHCVYSHSAGGWARRIEVIPGMNGRSRPFGSQVGTSFRSVTGWTRSRSPNYDYGAIILPNSNLGRRVGYFGFASLSSSSLRNLLVNNSGYPGDKPFGTQWFNAGRITSVTSRRIYYMLDTYGGQSGSPTWRYRNGQRHAVGIHAYGGCPNSSTRIVRPVFDNMMRWRNSCR